MKTGQADSEMFKDYAILDRYITLGQGQIIPGEVNGQPRVII